MRTPESGAENVASSSDKSESALKRAYRQSPLRLGLKGLAIGAANIVPGVSGGTLALVLNVYVPLIESIRARHDYAAGQTESKTRRPGW